LIVKVRITVAFEPAVKNATPKIFLWNPTRKVANGVMEVRDFEKSGVRADFFEGALFTKPMGVFQMCQC